MKNKNLNIIVLLTILFIASCKESGKDLEVNYLKSQLNKIKIDKNINWIVILPGLGCHGCIQEGEAFMQEYIENKQILFILTKVESLKILQNKIDIKVKEHQNIYVDKNDEFNLPTDNVIYPLIIYFNKGELISHEFQSPNNGNAMENLKANILLKEY